MLYPVYFNVDNRDRALLTNMTAQVFFVTSQAKDVLTVPTGALAYTDARHGRGHREATVQVVADDGSRETREVTIGVASRITAEVRSGLSDGETVIAGILTERQSELDERRGRSALMRLFR